MTKHRTRREALGQLQVTAGDNTAIAGSKSRSKCIGAKIIAISVRLWNLPAGTGLDVQISSPCIIPKKTNLAGDKCDDDDGVFLGTRNQYTMCSLYVQIGNLLGVQPQHRKVSMFDEIYRGWSLRRSRFHGGGFIRTLDDKMVGDWLVLNCGCTSRPPRQAIF